MKKVSVMAPIKSYTFYDLDNGRPILQQFNPHKSLAASCQYYPTDNPRNAGGLSPLAHQSSEIEYQSEMASSPEDHLSNSQNSWDSSDILRPRLHSISSVSASSPLSVNMSHDHLMTLGIYPGEPHLLLRTPPEDRFRYRYDTEMSGTHGSLQGKKIGKEKFLPTVELINYPSEALIRVSLVTCNESGERYPHPHSLFVKEKMYAKNMYVNWDNKTLTKTRHYSDPHYIRVGGNKNDYVAKFEGMCIISSKKENFYSAIKEKLQRRSLEQNYKSQGDSNYWGRNEEDLAKKAENGVRAVDVDFVSLCFEAFREENDKLVPLCQPLYSSPIGNAKSAKTGKLKIARINKCSGSCKGGDEIWMLVEKINKKGLAIRFSEESHGRILWETCVEGDDLILHHQYAIIFKTPPYRDGNISSEVEVTMRLERSSQPAQPCDYSEPMTFVYEPLKNKSTKSENLYRKESMLTPLKQTQNKRPRTDSSSVMSAYSFQNKRKSEDSDYPNVADSWIEQILTSLVKRDELDSYEFGQAWTKFNDEEFRQFIEKDVDMPLQKDGISNKYRRELIYKCLRSRLPKLGDAEIKKLTDQISTFRFFRKENPETKEKVQVEDAASTLLSLRAKAVENSDPTSADYNGNTPLHLFLSGPDNTDPKKFKELVQDFCTCINVKNNDGKTPLHLAVENENLPCLKLLVDHGARINETETKTERNALHLAVLKRNQVVFEYLSSIGVDPGACDSNGLTPLHLTQDLPLHQRKEFTATFHSQKTKKETEFSENEEGHDMDELYQILNDSGSWRKLAELWEVSFFIPHAEETKNPAKSIFHCAEQKHGRFSLEDLRNLLEGIYERKAVVIVDEILARKFL